jgi:hypothetical protein
MLRAPGVPAVTGRAAGKFSPDMFFVHVVSF